MKDIIELKREERGNGDILLELKDVKKNQIIKQYLKSGEEKPHIIYKLDISKKKMVYYIRDRNLPDELKTIFVNGYSKRPDGFKKYGQGFTGGNYLLYVLDEKFKDKISKITISKDDKTKFSKKKDKYEFTINYKDFKLINTNLWNISLERAPRSKNAIINHLHNVLPEYFDEKMLEDGFTYKKGELSKILEKNKILENLDKNDIEAINKFYMEFIHSGQMINEKEKIIQITSNKTEWVKIELEELIKTFEKNMDDCLKNKKKLESFWQTFLKQYIILLTKKYRKIIEKNNIKTGKTKIPDFMLVDIYNYIDIYEIKTPITSVLAKLPDKGRGNYYFSTEISKAISQVENYIYELTINAHAKQNEFRNEYGIDAKIIKPRGYIIAGARSQLKNRKMEDDFRLLNNGLKNVEIIFYDDLLANLKHFLERLGDKSKKE